MTDLRKTCVGTPAPWQVYLLECADGTFYCGVAKDPHRRLRQHNGELAGGARYTASRRPVILIAMAGVSSRSEAQRTERAIKKLPRREKLVALQRLGAGNAAL